MEKYGRLWTFIILSTFFFHIEYDESNLKKKEIIYLHKDLFCYVNF